MLTKEQAVENIVSTVEAICVISVSDEPRLTVIADHYYDMAAGFTGYTVLPDALLPFVRTATIRAWKRRGAEATSRFTGIGVTETYIDIEDDLKKEVRKMRNPLSPVVVSEESEASDAG